MDKKLRQTLLYDFYGELLTAHQKRIYEDFVLHDLSLAEIAEEEGISRQGVHDLVKRCDRLLENYEQKLQLLERFLKAKEKIGQIHDLTLASANLEPDVLMGQIRRLANEMIEDM